MNSQIVTPQELEDVGLAKLGQIQMQGGFLRFVFGEIPVWSGGVYAWVAHDKDGQPETVLYIGKAGKTLAKRCGEHAAGFKNSNKGKSHRSNILGVLDSDKTVHVWARHVAAPHHSEAEDALISKFDPPWNTHKRKVSARST